MQMQTLGVNTPELLEAYTGNRAQKCTCIKTLMQQDAVSNQLLNCNNCLKFNTQKYGVNDKTLSKVPSIHVSLIIFEDSHKARIHFLHCHNAEVINHL